MRLDASLHVSPSSVADDYHLKLVDRIDGGLVVFTDGSRILFPGEGIYFGSGQRRSHFGPDTRWPKVGDHPERAFLSPLHPNYPA